MRLVFLPVVILLLLADVTANVYVVDVISTYCQYVADVMATFGVRWWQMLLPSGRWNGHCRVGGNYGD